MSKLAWFERKVEVTRDEYLSHTSPISCWCESRRLEDRDTPPSLRLVHRQTGDVVAGWDKSRDGTVTYFIVTE